MSLTKNGKIQITSEQFTQGISASPYLGIQQMVNLDIHERPGVLRIARKLEKESGSTVTERIRYGGVDYQNGHFWGLDQDGDLYNRDTGGSWSKQNSFGTTDDGGVVWKDYFIAMRSGVSALLEAYGPLSSSPSDLSFESLSTSHTQFSSYVAFVNLDDKVFFGMDNVLHEIVEATGKDFDPTDSNTYSVNEQVLILPENTKIQSITEVGLKIIVGASQGDTESISDLFVWNPNKSGTASSAPDKRIPLNGDGVPLAITNNNLAYFLLGKNYQLKRTDLTSVEELLTINDTTEDPNVDIDEKQPAQSIASHDGGFIFGITKDDTAPHIYQLKNGAITSFTTSIGEIEDGANIGKVTSLSNDQILVAWEDQSDNSFGVDVTNTSKRYRNYEGYFVTQFYNVGSNLRDKTFQYVGITLAKKLVANQGIRVKYRENIDEDWTILDTFDHDTIGSVNSYEAPANLPSNLTNIQFRIEMTTADDDTTPELLTFYVL